MLEIYITYIWKEVTLSWSTEEEIVRIFQTDCMVFEPLRVQPHGQKLRNQAWDLLNTKV
jgi:hypothetical protein